MDVLLLFIMKVLEIITIYKMEQNKNNLELKANLKIAH